jgi:hypothetical protein
VRREHVIITDLGQRSAMRYRGEKGVCGVPGLARSSLYVSRCRRVCTSESSQPLDVLGQRPPLSFVILLLVGWLAGTSIPPSLVLFAMPVIGSMSRRELASLGWSSYRFLSLSLPTSSVTCLARLRKGPGLGPSEEKHVNKV